MENCLYQQTPIYVTRPSLPRLEDYIEEIKPIFESHIITNMGPIYSEFQNQLKDYLDVNEISMFVNGHMALEMAIQAIGLRKIGEELGGGEVITTPFTFVSTTHAIARNNLKPVFCDIRKSDYCIDPDKIEELITEKTVAIIPVHVYGNICDVKKIDDIAKKYNLKVIYDGAHAFGEKYEGRGVGQFGDATMFSFHATKVFNSIEGGAITFGAAVYSEPLHELKNFGIHGDDVSEIGGNAKMDEFRAAMGLCNMRHIDDSIASRGEAANHYCVRLGGVPGIRLCIPQPDVQTNYAYFPVYFDETLFGKSRDDVMEALKAHDIFARKYFYPAINELSAYRDNSPNLTPVAHDASLHILTLPLYEGLSQEDIDRICDIVLMHAN